MFVSPLRHLKSLPVDMAILSLCDHFISTVGTLRWWIVWLAGGNVTYYKWPAREKSIFREAFDPEYKYFFLSKLGKLVMF